MKFHTKEDIEDKIKELFPPVYDFYDYDFYDYGVVVKIGDDVHIKVGCMYSAPEPKGGILAALMDLAVFFDTKKIDMDDYAQGGCETCDYGSEYGFELIIKPE